MQRKIAIKRLTASDLTFFEHHYRNTAGAKQKSFNLDRTVFINEFYPNLAAHAPNISIRVSLSVRGPGKATAQTLVRKILKQEKNWRLNGELIYDPPESHGRYSLLQKGDFAIIEFLGGSAPDVLTVQLVAQAGPEDEGLHAAISKSYGHGFFNHKGMIAADPADLIGVLADAGVDPAHPVYDLLEADYIEDLAQGGLLGFTLLTKRPPGRKVTKEELQQAKENLERVGREGEELVSSHLSTQKKKKMIEDFEWTSDSNATASYDFAIIRNGQIEIKIDVKSTAGKLDNPVHVSMAELKEMVDSRSPYEIYRIHAISNGSGILSISQDMRKFAQSVYECLKHLPQGVVPDGFSIDPVVLSLGPPQSITGLNGEEELES